MAKDGYEYSHDALGRVGGALRRGAGALDGATTQGFTAPDAGASSGAVGKALSDLLRSAVAGAQSLDDMAGKVHATQGGYGEVENTNEGELRRQEQRGFGERNIPLN